ncbi:acyl carrier protein [Streptomyces nogalater]
MTSSFVDLGLDSIFRMELVRGLNDRYGLDLKASELYDHDNVEQLTSAVLAAMEEGPAPTRRPRHRHRHRYRHRHRPRHPTPFPPSRRPSTPRSVRRSCWPN